MKNDFDVDFDAVKRITMKLTEVVRPIYDAENPVNVFAAIAGLMIHCQAVMNLDHDAIHAMVDFVDDHLTILRVPVELKEKVDAIETAFSSHDGATALKLVSDLVASLGGGGKPGGDKMNAEDAVKKASDATDELLKRIFESTKTDGDDVKD